MPDWHYHANHVDGPPRGSKAAALRDAKAMHLLHNNAGRYLVKPDAISADTIRDHGIEFPLIVRCFRSECAVVK